MTAFTMLVVSGCSASPEAAQTTKQAPSSQNRPLIAAAAPRTLASSSDGSAPTAVLQGRPAAPQPVASGIVHQAGKPDAAADPDRVTAQADKADSATTIAPRAATVASQSLPLAMTRIMSGTSEAAWSVRSRGSVSPADPGLAVGPTMIVETTNGLMVFVNKASGLLRRVSDMGAFAGITVAGSGVSDPNIAYDPTSRRWFFVVLAYQISGANITGSQLVVKVSRTADPLGLWDRWSVDPAPSQGLLYDYPQMSVGLDRLLITTQDFTNIAAGPVRITSVRKADLLAAAPAPVVRTATVSNARGLVPARQVSPSTTYTLPTLRAGSASAVLVNVSPGSPDPDDMTITTTSVPVGQAVVTAPRARNSGGIPVDTIDPRTQSAIVRNGILWWSATVGCTLSGVRRACVRVLAVLVTGGGLVSSTLLAEAGKDTFLSSIAVDASGRVLVATHTSSAVQGPSSTVRVRWPDGRWSAPVTRVSAPYLSEEENVDGYARFGDYTTAVQDPTSPYDVWTSTMTRNNRDLTGPTWRSDLVRFTAVPSTLVKVLATSRVAYRSRARVTGQLLRPRGPADVGAIVVVRRRGSLIAIATTTTRSDGRFALSFKPKRSARYDVVALPIAATQVWRAPTWSWRITRTYRVSVGSSRVGVTAGGTTKLTGTVWPAVPGGFIVVQRRTARGWVTVAKGRLSSASRYIFRVRIPRGQQSLRVVRRASQGFGAGQSRVVSVLGR